MPIINQQDLSKAVSIYFRENPPSGVYKITLGDSGYSTLEIIDETDPQNPFIVPNPSEVELESYLLMGNAEEAEFMNNLSTINYVSGSVVDYVRKKLVEANGDDQLISDLYDEALAFTVGHPDFLATIQTLVRIKELSLSIAISVVTTSGKAHYLDAFLVAALYWRL